jgi:hypothetical protein
MIKEKVRVNTICIQIGNTDDKLTQEEWSEFCNDIKAICESYEDTIIHFCASSDGSLPWQNFCIVVEAENDVIYWMKKHLITLKVKYNQDSIAILEGDTEFI